MVSVERFPLHRVDQMFRYLLLFVWYYYAGFCSVSCVNVFFSLYLAL